jgi:hypothetical protein
MLDRQKIVVPLAQGVDTKTDEKQVEAGKLLELENGIFTRLRSLQKRHGNVAFSQDIANAPGTQVEAGIGLAEFGSELLEADGERLYSYDQGAGNWADKGAYIHAFLTQFPVIKDGYEQTMPDGATAANGTQLYAYEDSSAANLIKYCVIDGQTQQTLLPSANLTTNGIKPRVLVTDTVFAVYYVDPGSSQIVLATIPVANPLAAPTFQVLTALAPGTNNALNASSPNYDACIFSPSAGTYLIGLAFNNDNNNTTVRMYDYSSPVTQYPVGAPVSYLLGARCRSIALFPGNTATPGAQTLNVAYATDNDSAPYTASINFDVIDSAFNSLGSGTLASGLTYPSARAITGTATSATSAAFDVFWGTCLSRPEGVDRVSVDGSYSPGSVERIAWYAGCPVAKAFSFNGRGYVPIVAFYPGQQDNVYGDTALQSALYVIDSDGNIVARAFPSLAANAQAAIASYPGTLSSPLLASTASVDGSTFRFAFMDQVLVQGSVTETQVNVSSVSIDMDAQEYSVNHEELAQNLHLSGGDLQMYDGQNVVEHGFFEYPIIKTITAGGTGNIAPGQYYYTACYEWTDNQGNIHQSRSADPKVITYSLGNFAVSLQLETLHLTQKTGVQIIVYRTLAGGSIFYRCSDLKPNTGTDNQIIYNDETSAGEAFLDNLSDADLERRPRLYTQFLDQTSDAVVENDPAPPTGLIQLHRNRLWVVDSTNPLNVYYSKFIGPATPVAFNDSFFKTVDPRGGPITALATIDDKLLVFKYDQIFFVVGQGPENTGINNDLSDAILITTDVGCVDPRSIVGSPFGLLFKSRKGIYLIDRSLAVQYIGAAVEAYNDDTITSATLVADTNQVRFTLESGVTLVYDYFVQQWGVFTNQNAVDSLVWQSKTMLLRADGKVLQETSGVYTDDGQPIHLKLATSWFSFAQVQGFQRVRRAQLLGAWKSPHQLKISVCYDFDDTVVQEVLVSPTTPTTFGGSSPYGAGGYGGQFQLYQWRIDLARQKCQAVKFIIEDLPSVTGSGEGLSLSSLAFEVGAKQGLNKVPASQIVS